VLQRLAAAVSLCLLLSVAVIASAASVATAETSVTTAGYGNLRDNWDPNEPALGPSSVKAGSFGKRWVTALEGAIYAQPLAYKGDVIVTTERADAYAVNASTGAVVWKRNFGVAMKSATIKCSDLTPYLGSTSTPVIDPSTGIVYLTTRTFEGAQKLANARWYLQAISAATGEEEPGYPVKISGTPANTPGVPFNENYSQQRPGLLLLNGTVYIAFASDCDITPYRGIVVGVSTSKHEITSMWSDEAGVAAGEDSQAGIWQSGGGLVSDIPGRIILATGNGVSPQPAKSNEPPQTLSESVVGLTVEANGQLKPSQFFAPSNAEYLDQNDEDLGSGGPAALPTEYFGTKSIPHLVVQVGKDGRVFLINADNMGGYRQGPGGGDAVLQTLGPYAGVWGHPAVYGGQGGWVYIAESAGGGYLQALSYGLNGSGVPQLTAQADGTEPLGYTTGSPLVTSNGTSEGSAVVWVEYSSASTSGSGAKLLAYAAQPSGGTLPLLWSYAIGYGSKFAVPTAYEGNIYVGTRIGRLYSFGASAKAAVQAAPVSVGEVPVGQTATAPMQVSATQNVTLTGPVTVTGQRAVSATEPQAAAKPLPAATRTAGPKKIHSSGTAPLTPDEVSVLDAPRVGTALPAGGSLHLRIRLRPRHPGPVVGSVSIRTSAGTRTVTVTAYATRAGLVTSAQPLEFGTIRTRAEGKALTVTLTNSWNRPERLTAVRLPGAPFHVSGLPRIGTLLAPRHAVTLSVLFDPLRPGDYRSRLRIETDHGSVSLPTSGEALNGRPRLSVSPLRIDFGAVPVGAARTRTFHVRDTGTIPLRISRSIAPSGEFSAPVALPEGVLIEPRYEATITVEFRPTARGPATGTYVLNGDDGRGYVRVALTGEGT
jgi:hypothetical protein